MARTFTHHQLLRNPEQEQHMSADSVTECSSPKPLLGPCFENPVKETSCDSSQVRHPIGVASCSRTPREYLLNSGKTASYNIFRHQQYDEILSGSAAEVVGGTGLIPAAGCMEPNFAKRESFVPGKLFLEGLSAKDTHLELLPTMV